MKKFACLSLMLAFLFVFSLTAKAAGPEVIKKYYSQITVNQDASINVTETISVHAAGLQIKHGIYRDFPTTYRAADGQEVKVGFKVLNVERDGHQEDYSKQNVANGVRVYIGNKREILPEGEYTYVLTYRVTGELGFFEDHDELYWNVTGNGWAFPIELASADVTLPAGATSTGLQLAAYTGRNGEKGNDFTKDIIDGHPIFFTTRQLESGEGLTIVVGWPKGLVTPPFAVNKGLIAWLENIGLYCGYAGAILLLAYYLWVWNKFGRDPKKGVIIPQYEPPQGLSSAALGYVKNYGYSNKLFTASIISLAIKKFLTIEQLPGAFLQKGKYKLNKIGSFGSLSGEEKQIAHVLFPADESVSSQSVVVSQENHPTFIGAQNALKVTLEKLKFFSNNYIYSIAGIIMSIVIFASVAGLSKILGSNQTDDYLILVFPLILWSIFVAMALAQMKSLIADHKKIFLILLSIVVILLVGSELALIIFFVTMSSWQLALIFMSLLIMDIAFFFLLRVTTEDGRRLIDEIEGFKWFLTVTEKDRMNFHNPPERTPELFEKYLPYALALGVENKWSEQFNQVFAALQEQGNAYVPAWYIGVSPAAFNAGVFASSLGGSFSGAISAAAVSPGSSSGFGGGGFSGGGGGGGGGGGW